MQRFRKDAGIAIGPILFVIALLAVLGAVMSSGGSISSTTIQADRLAPDLRAQANLIRAKINECYMFRNSYPTSASGGTLVSALACPGDPSGQDNLWIGIRPSNLPPPPNGFDAWKYVNGGSTGGRCFFTKPTSADAASNPGVREALKMASHSFSDMESDYDNGSSEQRWVIWITAASGTPSTDCALGS